MSMLSSQLSSKPSPDPELLLHKQLRVLGLGMSKGGLAKYQALDDKRVGIPHVSMLGMTGGQIWLNPGRLIEGDVASGYGADVFATHYSFLGPKPLLLCQSLLDALTLGELLEEYGLHDLYSVAASTAWGTMPKEWQVDIWWRLWPTVYVVGTVDYVQQVQCLGETDVYVLEPTKRPGLIHEGDVGTSIHEWVERARILPYCPAGVSGSAPHLVPPKLVDVNGTFEGGHLYYPCRVLEIAKIPFLAPNGTITMVTTKTLVTRVVKSGDKTLHEVIRVPARPGAFLGSPVLALTDGTLIAKAPAPSARGTWSLDSILAHRDGTAPIRSLGELLTTIRTILQLSIWLPNEEDYFVLALVVVTTYVQAIFEAVPLVLANGPMGTGKTEVGKLMARVCANGYVIGKVSPSTTIRDIDKNRGFVVFDDLEEIGKKAKAGSVACSDFMQTLKVSNKKDTAIKVVTNPKTMETEILNFFGVKMFTNILGVEDVLGSRTLCITTAKKPGHFTRVHHMVNTPQLRNDLHVWAFENATAVDAAYQALPIVGSREEEIAAPLRVLAQMSGIKEYEEMLDRHLGKAAGTSQAGTSPVVNLEEIFQSVMEGLIAGNATQVSPTEVMAAMEECLRSHKLAKPHELKSVWVGWKLREFGYVAPREKDEGVRVETEKGFLRFYTLIKPNPPAMHTPPPIADDCAGPDIDGPGI